MIPAEDIRDIRPLILIPSFWHGLEIAVAIVLFLAGSIVAFVLWRRRSAGPLTPEERARRALAKAESLAREGRAREWADVVAAALRTALSARLGLDACPQTTSELASESWVPQAQRAAVDAPRLLEILSTCDLTRFAMARLDVDSLLAATQSSRDWITRLFAATEPSSPTRSQVIQ